MADSPIGSLASAAEIESADLFVLEQSGVAKKLSGGKLTEFINRNIVNVEVFEIEAGNPMSYDFDRVTGRLRLWIPRGNGIVSIAVNNQDRIVYTFADGQTVECERIKGDTGKSAYEYAKEAGYEGDEKDFQQLQLDLYNASLNEEQRVAAENQRREDYAYMMDRLEERINNFDQIVDKTDAIVVGRRLILNRTDVTYVPRTIFI